MARPRNLLLALPLLAVAGCGPYTPGADHASADAPTGSMLSGTDTGMQAGNGQSDPSLRMNYTGGGGGH